MIKNKYEFPRKGFKVNPEQEKSLAKRPEKENSMMFSVALDSEGADSQWSKGGSREINYVNGKCFLEGREISFEKAREEIFKSGKEKIISKLQKEALGIEGSLSEGRIA